MNQISLIGLVFLVTACGGKIPSEYRGNYTDRSNGATLELTKSEGTFTFPSGHVIKNEAKTLGYEQLLKGEAGLYMKENKKYKDIYDVYWISPGTVSTRTDQGQLVWYQTEVAYTMMLKNPRRTQNSLRFVYCPDGMVTLNPPDKTWEGPACDEKPERYNLVRTTTP